MAQNNRIEWLTEEMSVLTSPHTYDIGDDTAWTKVKCHFSSGRQMHVFAKICAWREKTAKLKNRPRRHIMKDDMVQELAVAHPTSAEQMDLMRSFLKHF